MKPSTLLATPLLAVVLFCIASCGGQESKSSDTTTTADSAATSSTMPTNTEVSTVTTQPQNMMVAKHKVANFEKWKASYEAHDSLRLAHGIHNYVIGRSLKDSNTVLVALKVDDAAKAKAFAKDPSLKQAMQKGGGVGAPVFYFDIMTFQDTSIPSNALRSRTTFKVKDWDKWQKSFDSSRQSRKENGIAVRAYGHDVDDNHKVTVVVVLEDTAKAFAYWKSDLMKKRLEASGVEGQPDRFLFRVVKRY